MSCSLIAIITLVRLSSSTPTPSSTWRALVERSYKSSQTLWVLHHAPHKKAQTIQFSPKKVKLFAKFGVHIIIFQAIRRLGDDVLKMQREVRWKINKYCWYKNIHHFNGGTNIASFSFNRRLQRKWRISFGDLPSAWCTIPDRFLEFYFVCIFWVPLILTGQKIGLVLSPYWP